MPVFHFFANLVYSYCPGLEAAGSVLGTSVKNLTYFWCYGCSSHVESERVDEKVCLFFGKDFIFIIFYWKGKKTQRRDREEDLPSDDSLPK